jgi:hypothetical protein
MAYELKDGQGSLFKNDRKEKDNHPGMTGSAMIGGVEYWVSSWKKDGSKGPWLSLAFKPKEVQPAVSSGNMAEDLADEIPF